MQLPWIGWREIQHGNNRCAAKIRRISNHRHADSIGIIRAYDMVLHLVDTMTKASQIPPAFHCDKVLARNAKFLRLCGGYYAVIVLGNAPYLVICFHVKITRFLLHSDHNTYYITSL